MIYILIAATGAFLLFIVLDHIITMRLLNRARKELLKERAPVSKLDEILHSDWYKPRDLKKERRENFHSQRPTI